MLNSLWKAELFDPRYTYVDRETEIEAYRYKNVREARRLGLSEERDTSLLENRMVKRRRSPAPVKTTLTQLFR